MFGSVSKTIQKLEFLPDFIGNNFALEPKNGQAKITPGQNHARPKSNVSKLPKLHTLFLNCTWVKPLNTQNIVLLDYLWLQLGFFIKAILEIIVPQETITMFVGQGRLLWRLNLQKWSEPLLS